ncbi:MAG: hypothetical protein J2P57_03535 [Acidimicrobiaceae bacterium]|nr:hypothetical protein [Acidimicrobiaceae bacterium]
MVEQIDVSPGARARTTLERVDYADEFLVDIGARQPRTAEQWSRTFLEEAPLHLQEALGRGWRGLGLRLGPARCEQFVAGWAVRSNVPDAVLLGADSVLGLRGELLFVCEDDVLRYATFVRLAHSAARAAWAAVAPAHRQFVRRLLEQPEPPSRFSPAGPPDVSRPGVP